MATEKGNRAAAQELGINKSMRRGWRQRCGEFIRVRKRRAFRRNKRRCPDSEKDLGDMVDTESRLSGCVHCTDMPERAICHGMHDFLPITRRKLITFESSFRQGI